MKTSCPLLPRTFVSGLAALAFAALVAPSALANPTLTSAAVFGEPPKGVEESGLKYLKLTKKIVVPTIYVRLMTWGKVSSVVQTSALQTLGGASNSSARSTMEVAVPVEVATARAIADELYADLIAQLRATGWEVLTYADVKGEAPIAGLKQEAIHPSYGAPIENVTIGKSKTRYLKVAPAGLPVIDAGITGPLFPLGKFWKEQNAHGLIVTYTFDPVAMQGQTRRGIGSNHASVKAQASLLLGWVTADFLNPKGAGGVVRSRNPRQLAASVGDLTQSKDLTPSMANAFSKVLGDLTGTGSISSKKGLYVLEVNEPLLRASAIDGGKAFNALVAKQFATQLAP